MALSFLYLGFTRILQLLRLSRRDSDELAILRRQVVRPALQFAIECVRCQ
jgi:hypothetical protein